MARKCKFDQHITDEKLQEAGYPSRETAHEKGDCGRLATLKTPLGWGARKVDTAPADPRKDG